MAIAVTAVKNFTNYKSWTITAADSDTATSFAHGMTAAPDSLSFNNLVTFASTATPSFAATADATNIYLLKSNTAGSGGLTAGTTAIMKIVAWLPHTIAT